MFPDEKAINNRNALKAKRYDEMVDELTALRARVEELEHLVKQIEAVHPYSTVDILNIKIKARAVLEQKGN